MLAKIREKREDFPEFATISAVFLRIFRDNRHEQDNREAILGSLDIGAIKLNAKSRDDIPANPVRSSGDLH